MNTIHIPDQTHLGHVYCRISLLFCTVYLQKTHTPRHLFTCLQNINNICNDNCRDHDMLLLPTLYDTCLFKFYSIQKSSPFLFYSAIMENVVNSSFSTSRYVYRITITFLLHQPNIHRIVMHIVGRAQHFFVMRRLFTCAERDSVDEQ